MISFSSIRDQLQTGDTLSFSGNSPLDWMIRFGEGEPYTHVGMVIKDGTDLYFWDAPGGGNYFPDPYQGGKSHPGCRVAPIDPLLTYYMSPGVETALYWRHLTPTVSAAQQASLRTFIDLSDGLPFPGSEIPKTWGLGAGLAGSAALGRMFKATIAGSFFCADLIAESYMRMGLLPIAPFPANSYSPADFNSADPTKLPLRGCTLSPTVQLSYP